MEKGRQDNQMQALTLQAWQSVQCWGESLWHMRSRNKRAEGGGAGEGADWGVSQWLRSLVVAALPLLVLPPFLLLMTTAAAMARAVVTAATGVIAAATGIGRAFALWHDCVGFFVTQAQAG
jgi:hypothetical protein